MTGSISRRTRLWASSRASAWSLRARLRTLSSSATDRRYLSWLSLTLASSSAIRCSGPGSGGSTSISMGATSPSPPSPAGSASLAGASASSGGLVVFGDLLLMAAGMVPNSAADCRLLGSDHLGHQVGGEIDDRHHLAVVHPGRPDDRDGADRLLARSVGRHHHRGVAERVEGGLGAEEDLDAVGRHGAIEQTD